MSAAHVNKVNYRWSTCRCQPRMCGRDHEFVGPTKLRVPIVCGLCSLWGSSASHGLDKDLQLLVGTKGLQPSPTARGYTGCVLKKLFFHLFLIFVVLMFILYCFGAQQEHKNIVCASSAPETNSSQGKKEKSQLLVWQSFGKVGRYHASLVLGKKQARVRC